MFKKRQPDDPPYLGSVLFFKHLILTVLLLMILIPTITSIYLGVQNYQLNKDLLMLSDSTVSADRQPIANKELVQSSPTSDTLSNNIADVPTYENLYPDLYGSKVGFGDLVEDNTIYLTFDDGPSTVTNDILDILKERDIKATFFVVGNELDNSDNHPIIQRIIEEGHSVGIHSDSVDYESIYASVNSYLSDFYSAWNKLYDLTGYKTEIFRFPGGSINSYNSTIYQEIISEMLRRGFVFFDWNISSLDSLSFDTLSESSIYTASTNYDNLNRVVLLLHDSVSRATTASTLPAIIDFYTSKGYQFKPLSRDTKPIVFSYIN